MKFGVLLFLAMAFLLSFVGCYQIHSDDDLRTVPATNNPNVIQDKGPKGSLPNTVSY